MVGVVLPATPAAPAPDVVARRLPEPGEAVADKYAIVRRLGEGGMGVVYEAMHLRLQQRLALKVLRPDVPDFAEVLARFEREARITAQLRSSHAARVVDVDTTRDGLPFLVMEFLEGRDLEAELQATGPLPVSEAADVLTQIAEAMGEAHALGVVHRDLKPSNVFVCRVDGRRFIKVLDFGISKSMTEVPATRLTASNAYFGTPTYAAPEQLRAAADADPRCDVWSAGVILFELLTGRPPFVGGAVEVIARVVSEPVPSPAAFRPDLPPPVCDVVMRALERDPAQRFATMSELAAALASFAPNGDAGKPANARGKLGEILVAEGLITEAELERALREQRRTGQLLGRVLVDMGLVAQADLMTALAMQQGIAPAPRAARAGGSAGSSRRRLAIALAVGAPLGIVVALGVRTALHVGRPAPPAAAAIVVATTAAPAHAALAPAPAAPVLTFAEPEPERSPATAPVHVAQPPAPAHARTVTPPRTAPTFDPTAL